MRAIQENPKARRGIKVYNNLTEQWETLETVISSNSFN